MFDHDYFIIWSSAANRACSRGSTRATASGGIKTKQQRAKHLFTETARPKWALKQAKDAKASKAVFGKSVVLHTKGKQNKKNLAGPAG